MKWLVILRHMGYSLLILTTANTLFGLNEGATWPEHAQRLAVMSSVCVHAVLT